MNLNNRTQRHRTIVEAIAAILAVLLRRVPELGLAIVERVMRSETLHLRAKLLVERVVCGSHVGPSGCAASVRHNLRGEHRALGLHRHVSAVAMPSHISLKHFQHVVVGIHDECAVGLHVAKRCELELKRSESAGECNLLVATEMLAGKYQKRVLEPRRVELLPRRVVECGESHAGHYCAERCVERCDVECARHVTKLSKPSLNRQTSRDSLTSGSSYLRLNIPV